MVDPMVKQNESRSHFAGSISMKFPSANPQRCATLRWTTRKQWVVRMIGMVAWRAIRPATVRDLRQLKGRQSPAKEYRQMNGIRFSTVLRHGAPDRSAQLVPELQKLCVRKTVHRILTATAMLLNMARAPRPLRCR